MNATLTGRLALPRDPRPAAGRAGARLNLAPSEVEFLDSLTCEVYEQVLLATADASFAGAATGRVINRLPVAWQATVMQPEVRSQALRLAQRELTAYERRGRRAAALTGVRSATRHFILAATAALASGYAAYLALLNG